MPEPVIVKFYSPVSEASIGALMKVVDQKLAAGVTQFTVLISTSGGSVFHGLTAYNYLKGIPAEVTTHNIGSVDSIGVALASTWTTAPAWSPPILKRRAGRFSGRCSAARRWIPTPPSSGASSTKSGRSCSPRAPRSFRSSRAPDPDSG